MTTPSTSRRAVWAAAVFTVALGACAQTPLERNPERLDAQTGTTVTIMPRPVELIAERSNDTRLDPFAFLAPFETDRMGARALFLWVSAPQNKGPLAEPRIVCDGKSMDLPAERRALGELGVSGAPYPAPAPWSAQWYFQLTDEGFRCLIGAHDVALETHDPDGALERFTAQQNALSGLGAFAARIGR